MDGPTRDDGAMDGGAMDDDPVLRSLGAELERDDPELAALLSGAAPFDAGPRIRTGHRSHALMHVLVTVGLVALLAAALLLPMRVVLGVVAMLFILGSPLAVCWLLESGNGPATRHP